MLMEMTGNVDVRDGQPGTAPLRLLYVGHDWLVWKLLDVTPFLAGQRAECGPDGACPIRSGETGSALTCDAVLVDDRPGDATPADVVAWLRQTAPELPVVLLTRTEALASGGDAVESQVDDVVVKAGVYRPRLLNAIRRVHRLHNLYTATAALEAQVNSAEPRAAERQSLELRLVELERQAAERERLAVECETLRAALAAAREDRETDQRESELAWAAWDTDRRDLQARIELIEETRRHLEAEVAVLQAGLLGAAEAHQREREAWEQQAAVIAAERDLLAARLPAVDDRIRHFESALDHSEQVEAALGATLAGLRARLEQEAAGYAADRDVWDATRVALERERDAAEAARAALLARGLLPVASCELIGYAVTSARGHLIQCNEAFARLFGFASAADAVNQSAGHPFEPLGDTAALDRGCTAATPCFHPGDGLTSSDGRAVRVMQWIVPVQENGGGADRVERIVIDLTSQALRDERSRDLERLARLGTLTSLMASDLEATIAESSAHPADAAARMTNLVEELVSFSRRQQAPREPFSLNAQIGRLAPVLQALVGSGSAFDITLGPDETVLAAPDDFEQLLTALVLSARDVLPSGGAVRIATRRPGPLDRLIAPSLPAPLRPIRLDVSAEGFEVQASAVAPTLARLVTRCDGVLRVRLHGPRRITLEVDLPTAFRER